MGVSCSPVLVLTGPVGAGKTTVMGAIVDALSQAGAPHAAVDLDALSDYYPRPSSDPYGTVVALQNLAGIWRNYRAAGAERLILATVIESDEDVERVREAVLGAEITVCRLRAPVPVLQKRIHRRELGAGLDWHLKRAAELAEQFERSSVDDFVVDTADRPVSDIAREVLIRARWLE